MSHSENERILQSILSGVLPSVAFNSILRLNSGIDKYDLAHLFHQKYDLVDSKVLQVIWHWKSTLSTRGISDDELDRHILQYLKEAGYQIHVH